MPPGSHSLNPRGGGEAAGERFSAPENHQPGRKYGDVLTTGQVARLCKVAPRTVSKWFDTGQLRGYRIPGSKDRRIPLQQLIRFMKAHGMPLGELETGRPRILIVDPEYELTALLQQTLSADGEYEVRVADSTFEAGALTQSFEPNLLIVDVDLPGMDGRAITRFMVQRPELKRARLIGMGSGFSDADRETLRQQGFRRLLAKPFNIHELRQTIEAALDEPD
ncbi:MAG: response regulator [Phycisphaerae bacterium]|jgi:excisionase family DNA binding protein